MKYIICILPSVDNYFLHNLLSENTEFIVTWLMFIILASRQPELLLDLKFSWTSFGHMRAALQDLQDFPEG